MINKEKLVIRVNEIFHDIEGKDYQKKHKDIFTGEALRWQKTAKKYFQNYKSPITVLDIGTGTGFIPIKTAEYLSEKDRFICSDISQEMLEVSKNNISTANFKCKIEYLKLDGTSINVGKATIITINSVVHHIPNLKIFFTILNSIVPIGGRIIIGHEPNSLFYSEKQLVNKYLFFEKLFSPKKLILSILRFAKINILLKRILAKKKNNSVLNKINKILLHERLINKNLSVDDINKMVDYHSPTAGAKIDKTKGINIEEIRKMYLPNFETEYFETYNFLSKMSNKNIFMRKLNKSLSKKHKGKGATFFIVLKKVEK